MMTDQQAIEAARAKARELEAKYRRGCPATMPAIERHVRLWKAAKHLRNWATAVAQRATYEAVACDHCGQPCRPGDSIIFLGSTALDDTGFHILCERKARDARDGERSWLAEASRYAQAVRS